MKHPDAKQRHSFFQPLQMRPTNQMNDGRETSGNRNNNDGDDRIAKLKQKPVPKRRLRHANSSESDSESDSDDEVPLSLLASIKPTKSTATTTQKRQRTSKTQRRETNALQTKQSKSNKRTAVHDLRNQGSASKASRQTTDRKSKPKATVQTMLSFAVRPKRESSQSSQSTKNEACVQPREQRAAALSSSSELTRDDNRMDLSTTSPGQSPSLTDGTSASSSSNTIDTINGSSQLQDTEETKEEETVETKRKKKTLRRIVSTESEIDFEPPVPQSPPHSSLLSQLYQRETRGNRIPSCLAQPKKWKTPSWVRLGQPPCVGGYQNSSRKIDHLAWDTMGVLLAVASHSTIRIYHWDMVRAAYLQGQKDQQHCRRTKRRNQQDHEVENSEFVIPPVLQFRVANAIASLAWNPFNEDQLIVGYRITGEVHMYNVDRLATWQSKNPRNLASLPHQSTYWQLSHPRTRGSANAILVLDSTTILVGLGAMVHCWKLSKGRKTSLLWRYQPPAGVTCARQLGANLVLLGTNRGHMCLLNWKKWNTERSFSTEKKPLVMQEWIPHSTIRSSLNQDQRGRMGIINIKVETSCPSYEGTNANTTMKGIESQTNFWGCCRISWVTVSGWLMSTTMRSPNEKSPAEICRATALVKYKNSDGTSKESTRQEYSQPHDPVTVCTNSKWMCWSSVPAVTKVLPHHDKRVLDGQLQVLRSEKRLLHYRDGESTHTIKLAGMTTPQSFAIHPDREWIAMGVGARVVLLVGRN
ncbi:unnamed protein product [Cylindrotheca closterium]|uniref:Uncharacterized protein n=1 Tax=Cylindrotheca closterium TaxID=2856 RepID=A0AAD2CZ59_9STRA|nr:unnamed protein product [Cylindrotheca closterium]